MATLHFSSGDVRNKSAGTQLLHLIKGLAQAEAFLFKTAFIRFEAHTRIYAAAVAGRAVKTLMLEMLLRNPQPASQGPAFCPVAEHFRCQILAQRKAPWTASVHTF